MSGIGKGGLSHGPIVEVNVKSEDDQLEAAKSWSEKYATDGVPAPICPRCHGPCAGAIAGLWCVSCGLRAYG